MPVLPEQTEDFVGIDAEGLLHLLLDFVRPRVLEVDLVEHGDDRQIVFDRGIGIGDGLGFDTLERIDQENRPFAARQRARDFV